MYQIFVAVNHVNWELPALVETWRSLGEVTHFQNPTGIDQWDSKWLASGKKEYNRLLLEAVRAQHQSKPIDLFFSYLSARWVYSSTIHEIKKLGIKTVNISFDDTHAYRGVRDSEGWCGNVSIARAFDLCVTCQNPRDVAKYQWSKARALFLPPGAPADLTQINRAANPRNVVCFVGQKYGVREAFIKRLQASSPVEVYGKGWEGGELIREDMQTIYAQVSINLGFGFIGRSRRKLGLKGRDFEVTAAGGFYLTSFHPELARCFEEGKEIEFYRNFRELQRKVEYYLQHPDEAEAIGRAAQQRVKKEHLWQHRFGRILWEVGKNA